MTLNQIQDYTRKLLSDNKIVEALEFLDNFMKLENISDREFSKSLILNSAKFKEIRLAYNDNRISYDEFMLQRNRIINGLLQLVEDIPLIISKTSTPILNESKSVIALENYQDGHLNIIRNQIIIIDKIIGSLIEQIKEKEKQILELRDQNKIEELNKKIENLRMQLKWKEEEYDRLLSEYERLQGEYSKTHEIKQEIIYLKNQIEEKNKLHRTLEDYFKIRIKENNDLNEKIRSLENELQFRKSDAKNKEEEIRGLRSQIFDLQIILKQKARQIELLNNDIEQIEQKKKGCFVFGAIVFFALLFALMN